MEFYKPETLDSILYGIKKHNKSIYIMGCGGVSMAIIADYTIKNQYKVVGVDINAKKVKADKYYKFFDQHHGDNIDESTGVLIISHFFNDIKPPEIIKAEQLGIPIIARMDFINYLTHKVTGNHKVIGVFGSHGKTTTTYFGFSLNKLLGGNPSILGGSFLPLVGHNYYLGDGDVFVENCEGRDEHLRLQSDVLVVPSIGPDHLEEKCYGNNYEKLKESFVHQFNQSGMVIYYGDGEALDAIAQKSNKTLGVDLFRYSDKDPEAHCYLSNFQSDPLGSTGQLIIKKNHKIFHLTLGVPFTGIKNFLNYSAMVFYHLNENNYESIADVSRFVYLAGERGTYCGQIKKTILVNNFAQVMEEFASCALNYKTIFPHKKIVMAIEITRLARYNREIQRMGPLSSLVDKIFMAPPWEQNCHLQGKEGGVVENNCDFILTKNTIEEFRNDVADFVKNNGEETILICCNYTKPMGLDLIKSLNFVED
jgi:UDP-N-acetylmuramate--alanine ligase